MTTKLIVTAKIFPSEGLGPSSSCALAGGERTPPRQLLTDEEICKPVSPECHSPTSGSELGGFPVYTSLQAFYTWNVILASKQLPAFYTMNVSSSSDVMYTQLDHVSHSGIIYKYDTQDAPGDLKYACDSENQYYRVTLSAISPNSCSFVTSLICTESSFRCLLVVPKPLHAVKSYGHAGSAYATNQPAQPHDGDGDSETNTKSGSNRQRSSDSTSSNSSQRARATGRKPIHSRHHPYKTSHNDEDEEDDPPDYSQANCQTTKSV